MFTQAEYKGQVDIEEWKNIFWSSTTIIQDRFSHFKCYTWSHRSTFNILKYCIVTSKTLCLFYCNAEMLSVHGNICLGFKERDDYFNFWWGNKQDGHSLGDKLALKLPLLEWTTFVPLIAPLFNKSGLADLDENQFQILNHIRCIKDIKW